MKDIFETMGQFEDRLGWDGAIKGFLFILLAIQHAIMLFKVII